MKSKNKLLIGIWIVLFAIFILLSINVVNGNLQNFNASVYLQVEKLINPLLTSVMIGISNIGEWFIYLPIALLFLIIPKSRLKIGVPVILTLSASAALNVTLKHMFLIERPDIHRLINETGYGFPSGHAMNGTVFIGLCAYLFIRYTYKRPLKVAVVTTSTVFMLCMGFSRIYLGVHTLTDVMGGYLAGLILTIFSILILQNKQWFIDKIKPKLIRV